MAKQGEAAASRRDGNATLACWTCCVWAGPVLGSTFTPWEVVTKVAEWDHSRNHAHGSLEQNEQMSWSAVWPSDHLCWWVHAWSLSQWSIQNWYYLTAMLSKKSLESTELVDKQAWVVKSDFFNSDQLWSLITAQVAQLMRGKGYEKAHGFIS